MRVLITGATGFIGGRLAARFRRDGLEVIGLGRSSRRGRALQKLGVDFRAADIGDAAALGRVFEPVDCVVHCAGRSGDWGRYRDFARANVEGTRLVARACARHWIDRLVFLSSPSIYFEGSDRLDVREDAPLPPRSYGHYARTKREAEAALFADDAGLRVIALRPRAVYGPGDTTFAPRLARMASRGRVPLVGGGRALVDVTYVENLVDAVAACLRAPDDAWGAAYNVSNGDPLTVAAWFDALLGVIGEPLRPLAVPVPVAHAAAAAMELAARLPFGPRPPLLTRAAVAYLARSLTLSLAKTRLRLGWAPRFDTRQSFADYSRRVG